MNRGCTMDMFSGSAHDTGPGPIGRFLRGESGAVTADYVVLTASIFVISASVGLAVLPEIVGTGDRIASYLADTEVGTLPGSAASDDLILDNTPPGDVPAEDGTEDSPLDIVEQTFEDNGTMTSDGRPPRPPSFWQLVVQWFMA